MCRAMAAALSARSLASFWPVISGNGLRLPVACFVSERTRGVKRRAAGLMLTRFKALDPHLCPHPSRTITGFLSTRCTSPGTPVTTGGIGDPVSSVTRLAGYILEEDLLPGKVELVSIPPVVTGVPGEVQRVERNPVIVLDGCGHRCGSNALNLVSIKPAARLFTPRVRSDTKHATGRRRPFPEITGQKLAKDLAERAAAIARHML